MKNKLFMFFTVLIMVPAVVMISCKGPMGPPGIPGKSGPLVDQVLDFTENPIDIPNPDRGFERGNDDAAGIGYYTNPDAGSARWSYMTVPASSDTILGQTFQLAYEMTPPFYFGGASKGPEECDTPCEPRIVQFYLVLNNFSSNAWCESTFGTPGNHTREGEDGPITAYGLAYIRQQLQFIRDNTNSVCHIRPCYDPKGWNQIVWNPDNLLYEEIMPAGNTYYQAVDYDKPAADYDDHEGNTGFAGHLAKKGAGTWRGSSPRFRMCTVPGYTDLNWVQYHYLQLKPIFQEYSDIIWAFDSGTYGPWGETHSCYEAEVTGTYKMLLDSMLDMVPDGKPIMTHVGAFLDWYNRTYNTTYTFGTLDTFPPLVRGTPEARFGMFSDSTGFSEDEWAFGNNGSWTEGYRMLAYDPILPGYNPTGVDPSLTRDNALAPGGKVSAKIGYNDTGTNRLMPVPADLDPRWRGAYFIDWDRTKCVNFFGKMSVYGGEQIAREPASHTNGGFVPVEEWYDADEDESPEEIDVILRTPSILYEGAVARQTYWCIQQGSGSFKSRADYPYTEENINVELTWPWSGDTVEVLYDPVYEGQNSLAYYRDRMGYRLVLREAKATEWVQGYGLLKFEGKIQNVGWGVVFNKKTVKVILKSSDGYVSNAVPVSIDPYSWQPAPVGPNGEMPNSLADNTEAWRNISFQVPMNAFGYLPPGDYGIYLKINDPKEKSTNKRSIRFANNAHEGVDPWDESIGANLIGTVEVR